MSLDAFNMNTTVTMVTPNVTWATTAAPPEQNNVIQGFIACAVAVVFFGSNFIPVKKFDSGDGMFFQWIMCSLIWITGLITHCVRDFPTFYPLAMLGGFLWATGNVVCVPIIQAIGMTQGILVWASINLFTGWVTGRFGLLGLTPEVPNNIALNYTGMGLCLASAFIYASIKTTITPVENLTVEADNAHDEESPLLGDGNRTGDTSVNGSSTSTEDNTTKTYILNRLSPKLRRIVGISLAVGAGLMFGVNFAPVIYIQNNYSHNNVTASQNGLDYVFAHFSGIYATSTLYFLVYCAAMRNAPVVYPRIILPAALCGAMWGVADIAFFMANADLSEAVSFPIISSGPGMVAALWGVFLFKEITGKRNLILLLLAFSLAIAGAVLTGVSRI